MGGVNGPNSSDHFNNFLSKFSKNVDSDKVGSFIRELKMDVSSYLHESFQKAKFHMKYGDLASLPDIKKQVSQEDLFNYKTGYLTFESAKQVFKMDLNHIRFDEKIENLLKDEEYRDVNQEVKRFIVSCFEKNPELLENIHAKDHLKDQYLDDFLQDLGDIYDAMDIPEKKKSYNRALDFFEKYLSIKNVQID